MANNNTLIQRLLKRNFHLTFNKGACVGAAFRKDKDEQKNQQYMAENINQIKSITEAEWNVHSPVSVPIT